MAITVADLISEALLNLQAIQTGVSPTSAESADALMRLNQMLARWSVEERVTYIWYHQAFALVAGTIDYTLGTAGTFPATATPIRVTGACAIYQVRRQPVEIVSFEEFARRVKDPYVTSSLVPSIVAADNSYPNINLRVFPPPRTSPGGLDLTYYAALTQFASTATSVSLPPGWEEALHLNLAVELYPSYPRVGGMDPVLAARAQEAKASLVGLNDQMHAGSTPAQAAA